MGLPTVYWKTLVCDQLLPPQHFRPTPLSTAHACVEPPVSSTKPSALAGGASTPVVDVPQQVT